MMLAFATLLSSGCGDKPIESDTSTSPSAESVICVTDSDCSGGEICQADETGLADCVDGDRNNSLDEATYLLWDESIEGYINPDGDLDYYTFSTYGQEYVRITTITEREEADTVVTLRDPLGKVVTYSDNFATGSEVSSLDSVVYAYLAYEGEYLITVEDIGTHMGEDPYGHPSYLYTLNLTEWSQVTSEPDSFSDGPLSLELENDNMWNSVGVHIQSEGDQDYIHFHNSIVVDNDDGSTAPATLYVSGVVNLEESDLTPRVKLYNADGELLSEMENVGPGGVLRYPKLATEDYVLEIDDANGGGGDNAWTFNFLLVRNSTFYPLEIEPNNDSLNANTVSMTELSSSNENKYAVGRVFGELLTADDSDWFTIDHQYATEGDAPDGNVIVCLNSQSLGSTALPVLTMLNSAGEVVEELTSEVGSPNTVINLSNLPNDTYSLNVHQNQSNITTGLASWYQMLIYSTSFNPSSFDCP